MVMASTREIKLETIRRSVEEANKLKLPAIKEKLIGCCGEWWGSRRQSAQELIKQLETQEQIICDGEEVWTYQQWEKIKTARENDYRQMTDIFNEVFQDTLK